MAVLEIYLEILTNFFEILHPPLIGMKIVNVDFTVEFVIINNVGMMINAGVNAKNWLIKAHAIKDLFAFVCNPSDCECECYKSCDFSKYLDYKSCKCKKRLVDKLAEECTENIEETRLKMKINISAVLARWTLFDFQYVLQLTLQLVAIFFVFIGI